VPNNFEFGQLVLRDSNPTFKKLCHQTCC